MMAGDGRLGCADRATRASTEPASGLGPDGRVSTDADLFPDTLAEGEIAAPERGLDLRTEYLKETFNLPEGWVWHSFEALEDRPPFRFAKYVGGVYPFAKTRGKYKGRTDYSRPAPDTERTVVLDDEAFEAWLPSWEAKTGLCHTCHGTGQKWVGWDHKEGNKYVDCRRCGVSGKAPQSSPNNTPSQSNEQ